MAAGTKDKKPPADYVAPAKKNKTKKTKK